MFLLNKLLYTLCGSLAHSTGFVGPVLVGAITSHHTHAEWSIAFIVSAGVMAVGALVYLLFARADVQHWALENSINEKPVGAAFISTSAANADYSIAAAAKSLRCNAMTAVNGDDLNGTTRARLVDIA